MKELLEYSIKKDLLTKKKWIEDMFTFIAEDSYEDEYVKIENKSFYYKKDDEYVLFKENYDNPALEPKDKIKVPEAFLLNITNDIETTVGRLIMNYLLVVRPFGKKVPYINEKFDVKYIEKKYIKHLLTNDLKSEDKITMVEYHIFLDTVLYVESLANKLSIAASKYSVTTPPGMEQAKAKAIADAINKHGPKALEDPKVIAEIEGVLKKIDEEWISKDPNNKELMNGGKQKIARKKLHIMYGMGNAFKGVPGNVKNSLSEGWDLEPKELIKMFNDARAGSYSRGAETQKGGVTAKDLLRSTSNLEIVDTDCKSTLTLDLLITDDNKEYLVNRYIIDGGKLLLLKDDNIDKYLNKVVKLRSPMYCKLKDNFCSICMGEHLKNYKNGISLMATDLGGTILTLSLKKFHGVALSVTEFNIDEIV